MKKSGGAKTILVVEDEPGISQVCLRTLTSEGFAVDIAINGMVAQDMIGAKEYNLVIIDFRTPLMNGRQLFEHIRASYPELVSRVIFTTGDVINNDTQYFLEQSDRPLLPKPFSPDELKGIVRKALSQLNN